MPRSVEELLEQARARLARLTPPQAAEAQSAGAILVDIRGDDQIRAHGRIPGALRVPRNVLEWRADPTCSAHDPRIADGDAVLVIVCQEGFQSSLAAHTLHDLGIVHATDLVGGFDAWRAAGLPVEPVDTEIYAGRAARGPDGGRDSDADPCEVSSGTQKEQPSGERTATAAVAVRRPTT